jgi:hypothetical protein
MAPADDQLAWNVAADRLPRVDARRVSRRMRSPFARAVLPTLMVASVKLPNYHVLGLSILAAFDARRRWCGSFTILLARFVAMYQRLPWNLSLAPLPRKVPKGREAADRDGPMQRQKLLYAAAWWFRKWLEAPHAPGLSGGW